MELNKNGLLLNYFDSIDKPDLLSSYKITKLPSLNEYAENYLSNLDKPISNYDINNNSNENMLENNLSVKRLSINNSNNDSIIKTNQISKVNDKLTSNRYDETTETQKQNSNQLKERDNLSIEHLKKNFKNRKSNMTSNYNYSQYTDNKQINLEEKINNKKIINIEKNKKGLSELYKKISPPERTRLNSPIFSAFRSNNSKNSCSSKYVGAKVDYSNLSKSVNSLNDNKISNKSKSFLSEKGSACNNIRNNTKFSANNLTKNFLTNYIYSDRDKFIKKDNKTNNKNRIQMNFSESHTSESFIPLNSISNRYNTNKSYSKSVENYWKEKEIKKQIKIQKIRKEKNYKEFCEIRDKPEIDKNSRKIANKLGYNSSLNVFERLSELAKNQLIFNERQLKKIENYNYKLKLYKEINYKNYINRNRAGLDDEPNFKSLKQFENNNNKSFNLNILENINKEQNKKKNKKKDLINLSKYINKNDNQRYTDIGKDKVILNSNQIQKQWNNSYNFENENELKKMKLRGNINSLENNNIRAKIMYKKIESKKNSIENEVKNKKSKNGKNNKILNKNNNNNINKSLFINKPDNLNLKKNKINICYNYNSKKNHNYTTNENNQRILSIKSNTKNNTNNNKNNKSQQNINDIYYLSNIKLKKNNLNTNNVNFNNNFYLEDNKIDKYNNELSIFNNTLNNINNKKNNKITSKSIEENQKQFNNKLTMKRLDNSLLINANNNKEFTNKNIMGKSQYFKIPSKNKFNKEKNKIYIFKSEDYSFNKNKSIFNNDKNNNAIYKINNKTINNQNLDNHLNMPTEINNKINNKFGNNNLENYINIPSNSNEEKRNNIKKRKLELLKLLDFSSSIGNNNK